MDEKIKSATNDENMVSVDLGELKEEETDVLDEMLTKDAKTDEEIIAEEFAKAGVKDEDFAPKKEEEAEDEAVTLDPKKTEKKPKEAVEKKETAKKPVDKKETAVKKAPAKKEEPKAKLHTEITKDARKREKEREERNAFRTALLTGLGGLQTALNKGNIVRGLCTGVDIRQDTRQKDKKVTQVSLALIVEDKFFALIPFEEIFVDNPIDPSSVGKGRDSLRSRQMQMARKFRGQMIEFCVKSVDYDREDPTENIIMGSRREALLKIESHAYKDIEEGSVQDAMVISVSRHGALINLGGVDCRVPMREMTYRYVNDLEKEFAVGSVVKVMVRSLKKLANGRHEVEITLKELELKSALLRKALLKEGTETEMIVTTIVTDKSKNIKLLGWLPYYSMPAIVGYVPANAIWQTLTAGRRVRVRVHRMLDNGMVFGICTGIEDIGIIR